jgi:hypothetical protein
VQKGAKLTQVTEQRSFGDMLRFLRGQTVDRGSGKPLSQESLALRISDTLGLNITRNTVNNWENGKTYLNPHRDRHILTAIVAVLHKYRGIKTLAEADQLLTVGGFRALNPAEATLIDPQWVKSTGAAEEESRQGSNPSAAETRIDSVVLPPSTFDSNIKPNTPSRHENSLMNALVQTFFTVLDKIPDRLLDQTSRQQKQEVNKEVTLIDP